MRGRVLAIGTVLTLLTGTGAGWAADVSVGRYQMVAGVGSSRS